MESKETNCRCVGCGAVVPDIDAPTHAYIGASPGCWSVYCDVLGREYGPLRNPPWHRFTVDAYAAQHPGVESRRSVQSVTVHLLALHLLLDRGLEPGYVTRRLGSAVKISSEFHWLTPPSFARCPTVLDVAATVSPEDHERAVKRWASGVWRAWACHHAAVIDLASRIEV